MRADHVLLEQRLDEVEALWLEGATRNQMIFHLQGPTPLAECRLCMHRPKGSCTHGPPRWCNEQGEPIPARTISWYLQKAKARLFEQSWKHRQQCRLLTLAQIERAIARCFQYNNLKELATFLRFRAELDGSKIAAEEEQEQTLFEKALEHMASCEGYQPKPAPKQKRVISKVQARFLLQRLLHLLKQADPALVAYRQAKKPTNDVEARLYLRIQLVEAVHQSLTHPDVTPEGKRDALQKLGATYAMIAKDTDLAEHLIELKTMLQHIHTQNEDRAPIRG